MSTQQPAPGFTLPRMRTIAQLEHESHEETTMKQLHSEILIQATPAQVWAILTDFDRYADWNPFVVKATGIPEQGQRLSVTMSPPGGRPITLKPHVTEAAAESVLEWWGHLGVRGILDGRHRFELHQVEPGTRLVQMETFTGVLVPLLARSLDTGTLAGFNLMNAALKSRVEEPRTSAGDTRTTSS